MQIKKQEQVITVVESQALLLAGVDALLCY